MANGASELRDRMFAQHLFRVCAKRLRRALEAFPLNSEMTRGAAVDAVEILYPDLFHSGRDQLSACRPVFLLHQVTEVFLVVLPFRRDVAVIDEPEDSQQG